jgi:hypothetical protein
MGAFIECHDESGFLLVAIQEDKAMAIFSLLRKPIEPVAPHSLLAVGLFSQMQQNFLIAH